MCSAVLLRQPLYPNCFHTLENADIFGNLPARQHSYTCLTVRVIFKKKCYEKIITARSALVTKGSRPELRDTKRQSQKYLRRAESLF